MNKGPVSSALSPAQPCQTPTWIGHDGRPARAKPRGCQSRSPTNDPLFIFGIADGWPGLGADSYRPDTHFSSEVLTIPVGAAVRSIPSKRTKPRRPVRKPSASPMPGTRPTPTQRHQFLTETKSPRMLRRPIPDSPEKLNPSRRVDRSFRVPEAAT